MEKTWRWFGKKDRITPAMLRQIGVEGIVTSLYDVPGGEVWPAGSIASLQAFIESFGLRWSVVESLPVAESIKYGGPDREQLIENYKASLENLGKAGIKTVVYNFMPVIDWIRTDLNYPLPDGTQTLYFDKIQFAYFDCFILNRKHAVNDYTPDEMRRVEELQKNITDQQRQHLIDTIVVKTQGFVNKNFQQNLTSPVELFNDLLSLYKGIGKQQLRDNLKYFLEKVIPVAKKWGINLAIHPDDPPFPVLGLPRIVGNKEDIQWILESVNEPHNGITFCAGSLSSGIHNNVVEMAKQFKDRTHFLHLRSTEVFDNGNFMEAPHLSGRGHLTDLIKLFEKERPGLPMRVDHGKLMLDDINKPDNPGYSFYGRMQALAEISGVLACINN